MNLDKLQSTNSTSEFVWYCLSALTRNERRKFFLVALFGVISATAELLGIAVVIPLVQILLDGDAVSNYSEVLAELFGLELELNSYFIASSAVFALIVAFILNLAYIILRHQYSKRLGARFSSDVFRNYLMDDISTFYSRSQAELVVAVEKLGVQISEDVILCALHVLSRFWLLMLVIAGMLYIDAAFTVIISTTLFLVYLLIHTGVRRYVKKTAKENYISYASINKVKIDAYLGYRQVHINQLISKLIGAFSKEKLLISRKEANINVVGEVPRVVLETIGLICLILGALYLHDEQNPESFLPTLIFFAASAYRVLPAVQQIYHSANRITSVQAVADKLVDALDVRAPVEVSKSTGVDKEWERLRFQDVSFRYDTRQDNVFSRLSMDVRLSGMTVFVGESGKGKTTLFDLILGFREPSAGVIDLDGEQLRSVKYEWWSRVAYIPQNFHIFGETVVDVLCAGRDRVPVESIKLALKITGLDRIFHASKITLSCDGSVLHSLSGGEKCRLAVAVALVSGKPIIVADEPFAALDIKGAESIMVGVRKHYPQLCWLLISHRVEELGAEIQKIELP